MKQCKKCLIEKDESEFYSNYYKNTGKNYLVNACKACTITKTNKYYYNDREKQKEIRKKNTNAYRLIRKEIIFQYLILHPCADCGEKDPIVLEFDHLGDKTFGISNGLEKPIKILIEEINKCEVVCSNCHKKRTAKKAGDWYKDKSSSYPHLGQI